MNKHTCKCSCNERNEDVFLYLAYLQIEDNGTNLDIYADQISDDSSWEIQIG